MWPKVTARGKRGGCRRGMLRNQGTNFLIKTLTLKTIIMNDGLIECYVHEIEGHYFERNFMKDSLNYIGLDPSTDSFLLQKSTDCG